LSLAVALKDRRGDFELNVAFESGRGVTALFGRSGAGKTSIVSMVAGLRRPDRGRIVLNDRVLFDSSAGIDLPTWRRNVGMVFQEARLFPHLSVKANLLYARWAGWRHSAMSFDSVLSLLGLEDFLERRPASLSGGEAQRVAIGRALMAGPDILLMDEPLSQLDGARRAEILPFLERLAHAGGVPILYVSHNVDEVARLADSIVVLAEGRVVASGPLEDVFGRIDLGSATGRHEAGAILVAEIIGEDPDFALTQLEVGGAALVVPALGRTRGTMVRLRIRSQDVALALAPPTDLSIRNVIPMEIVSVEMDEGAYAEILLTASGQYLRARITRKSAVELGLRVGLRAFALIKSIAVEADRLERGASPRNPLADETPVS
jgi:molybdate transport system ATP-binding protein